MTPVTELLIEGLATAVPIIVMSTVVLYRFKSELCTQINDLKVQVETHIHIAEKQEDEFERIKERLTNVILRNGLKL
jgi:hypothetical protein